MADGECPPLLDDEDEFADCVDDSGDVDEDWDDWVDEDESSPPATCLFCDQTRPSPAAVLKHCYRDHGFDVRQFCQDGDSLSYVRLINYVRIQKPKPEDISTETIGSGYLKPADVEDPMLQFDIDDVMELDLPNNSNSSDNPLESKLKESEERLKSTEAKLSLVLEDLETMRKVAHGFIANSSDPAVTTPIQALTKEEDSAYVQPYGHYSIHQEMLQDKVRTSSYGQFMLENPHIFRDKVVLDVGCGTGILSMFAAKAGAKKVFAIDHSDIYIQARDIVHENGYDDVITVIHGKLEDVELPVEEVDIIISEWMGYFLLFESMLDTIIFAREKWLKPDGSLYPDVFTISLCASGDTDLYKNNVGYWSDVYGFKMSCMRDLVVPEAAVENVKQEKIITDPVVVKTIDANTIALTNVDFTSEFKLAVRKSGSISAIVGYFDTFFKKNAEKEVSFSTGPHAEVTHWKQTVFLVEQPIEVKEGDVIEGAITCRKNPRDPRSLKVSLTLNGKTRKYVVE